MTVGWGPYGEALRQKTQGKWGKKGSEKFLLVGKKRR